MLSKSEFKQAFREAMEARLEADLAAAPQEKHEFSPEFRARMDELFRTGKPNNKKGITKRGKRILLIAIAAVLALTATACAVPEIRESIAGFFVKVFGDHVEYTEPQVTKDRIEEEYGLVPIPEGFEEYDSSKTNDSIIVRYRDKENNTITFEQAANKDGAITVDNENGQFTDCVVDGRQIRLLTAPDYMHAAWVENGYYFSLSYASPIDPAAFKEWIKLVKIK